MSEQRRSIILQQLEKGLKVTGEQLANDHNVTRQVIVKDIAILRASGYPIISTPRGYYIAEQRVKRIFVIKSEHESTVQALEKELLAIVEHGGRIIDVIIEHQVYHEIRIILDLKSLADVKKFIEQFLVSNDAPLAVLTGGVHYHTIEVDNEQQEKLIMQALATVEQLHVTKALDK